MFALAVILAHNNKNNAKNPTQNVIRSIAQQIFFVELLQLTNVNHQKQKNRTPYIEKSVYNVKATN